MRTDTLVQATADVVTIVTLKPGDVFKRLHRSGSSFDSADMYSSVYGVVQTVDSNGEDTMITVIELSEDYTGVSPKVKVYGTDSDLKLFATTPEEAATKFGEFRETLDKKVVEAERALERANEQRDTLHKVLTWSELGQLSRPEIMSPHD